VELVLKNEEKRNWAGRTIFIICIAIIFLLGVYPQESKARNPVAVKIGRGEAKVTALEGTAQYASEGGRWHSVKIGSILKGGDRVATGSKSRLEIVLSDGSLLRFADNTSFRIVQIDVNGNAGTRNAKVNVALGKTWANVSKTFGVKPNFEVSCENAVAGVRGTIYRMNVNDDQSALVRVYEGEVAVSGGGKTMGQSSATGGPPEKISGPVSIPGPRKVTMEEWVEIVRAMQQITISTAGLPGKPQPFTDAEDQEDWVDWNKQRDANATNANETSQGETGNGSFIEWFK